MADVRVDRFDWSRIWLPICITLITAGPPILIAWGKTQQQIQVLERQTDRVDQKTDKIVSVAQDVAVLKSEMRYLTDAIIRIENSLSRSDNNYPRRRIFETVPGNT